MGNFFRRRTTPQMVLHAEPSMPLKLPSGIPQETIQSFDPKVQAALRIISSEYYGRLAQNPNDTWADAPAYLRYLTATRG